VARAKGHSADGFQAEKSRGRVSDAFLLTPCCQLLTVALAVVGGKFRTRQWRDGCMEAKMKVVSWCVATWVQDPAVSGKRRAACAARA
jgi:hypothetical protein